MTYSMAISSERSLKWIPNGRQSMRIGFLFFAASYLPKEGKSRSVLAAFGVISILFGMYRYERALTDKVEAVKDLSLQADSIQLESTLYQKQKNKEISGLRQELIHCQANIKDRETAISTLEQEKAKLQDQTTRQEKEIQDLRRRPPSPEEIDKDSSSSSCNSFFAQPTPRSFDPPGKGTTPRRPVPTSPPTTEQKNVSEDYDLKPVPPLTAVPLLNLPPK